MNGLEFPNLLGDWLKARRKALDLTQEELAQRAGCSVFALRKIESGERRPSKQLAALLAVALEIPEGDQPTFIRVARGESNLERLHAPSLGGIPVSHADTSSIVVQRLSPIPQPATHHLPLQSTPLLGRDMELAALERLFNESQCRLLTLTGMGGIGKTRLAIEFASRMCDMFSDGVHYVPLASINSGELIVPAIAETLEFSFSGPVGLQEQLFHYLAHKIKRPALLVLDNLEHLLVQSSVAAELVVEILQKFSNIKVICTSRERLNLHGEWTYELHGLPIPPSEFVDRLEDYSAATLFMQRARQIDSEFELTESEKPNLVKICHLVEGIPLAIELAAAWVGMLSCREIALEIETNIDFLTTSMRNIPERHRSLKATFDHSWRLLSGAERDTLSRLSVFHGGFDRAAAERVAGATLPLLLSLVSKSLVRRTKDGRYDLHEVIRQYAMSQLLENQKQYLAARDFHCEYYLKLVADREKALKSAAQQDAMRELTREMDNIRVAWVWGVERQKFPLLGASVRSLGWVFEVGGWIREGIDQLELFIQALKAGSRDKQLEKALGAALLHHGLLYFRSGQFVNAQEHYNESISILRSVNEQTLLADALIFNGTLAHLCGDYPEARTLIQEGLAYAQAANDLWFTAYGIYNLGHVDSLMGEYQKGYEQMQEGLKIWREFGDPHSISLGLNFLVNTQIKLGRYEEAKQAMLESISLCDQTKNRWGMGTAYRYLGLATLAEGQYIEAQDYLQKSLEIFGEYFEGWDIAKTLIYLGDAAILSGELTQARNIFLKALHISLDAHSNPLATESLLGLAQFYRQVGDEQTAFGLSHHVINNCASTAETKDSARKLLQDAEGQLSPEQIQSLMERWANRSLESISDILSLK